MTIRLTRHVHTPTRTLGVITWPGMECQPICTLEQDWCDNAIGKSCIPTGTYRFEKWNSPTFKRRVIRLLDEDTHPRTAILIHPANYVRQLRGCVAPGMAWQKWGKDGTGVAHSNDALDLLMANVPDTGTFVVE